MNRINVVIFALLLGLVTACGAGGSATDAGQSSASTSAANSASAAPAATAPATATAAPAEPVADETSMANTVASELPAATAEGDNTVSSISAITTAVATTRMAETKEFYTKYLGMQVVSELEWRLELAAGGEGSPSIVFMLPNAPFPAPIFESAFPGQGLYYTISVADVDQVYEVFKTDNFSIDIDIRDEEWGERHFFVRDPNGIVLNISHIAQTP